jgi:hypothetical protein
LATCSWLLAGYLQLAAGYLRLVTGCWLILAGSKLNISEKVYNKRQLAAGN